MCCVNKQVTEYCSMFNTAVKTKEYDLQWTLSNEWKLTIGSVQHQRGVNNEAVLGNTHTHLFLGIGQVLLGFHQQLFHLGGFLLLLVYL